MNHIVTSILAFILDGKKMHLKKSCNSVTVQYIIKLSWPVINNKVSIMDVCIALETVVMRRKESTSDD